MASCMRVFESLRCFAHQQYDPDHHAVMQYSEKGLGVFGKPVDYRVVVLLVNLTVNKLTGASIDKGVGGWICPEF